VKLSDIVESASDFLALRVDVSAETKQVIPVFGTQVDLAVEHFNRRDPVGSEVLGNLWMTNQMCEQAKAMVQHAQK
jgi:hypothetical protein